MCKNLIIRIMMIRIKLEQNELSQYFNYEIINPLWNRTPDHTSSSCLHVEGTGVRRSLLKNAYRLVGARKTQLPGRTEQHKRQKPHIFRRCIGIILGIILAIIIANNIFKDIYRRGASAFWVNLNWIWFSGILLIKIGTAFDNNLLSNIRQAIIQTNETQVTPPNWYTYVSY